MRFEPTASSSLRRSTARLAVTLLASWCAAGCGSARPAERGGLITVDALRNPLAADLARDAPWPGPGRAAGLSEEEDEAMRALGCVA